MKNYSDRIKRIKKQHVILQGENFKISPSGTHHKVFISKKYAIRFQDDNPNLLQREANFLKKLNHPLIPKIILKEKINQKAFMVENRLPGGTIDLVWKNLSNINKQNIIKQIIDFLKYQRTQTNIHIYSVNTGKKYKNFLGYLTDNINQKITKIKKIKQTDKIMRDILLIINQAELKNLFIKKSKNVLVHGDIIIHNLQTDGKNLTGILDWELSLFGDYDYDICRLFYYQECAKAYQEQGIDESFESDFMDKLITAIKKSKLIKNNKLFKKKYSFIRAIFFINALYWAACSNKPSQNINELTVQWDKK